MVYGSFVPIVRKLCLSWMLVAACASARADSGTAQADAEASLLHRRIELSNARQWDRVRKLWLPLYLPPAKVYVVNLWSVHCPPCRKEFPQLRMLQQGWRSHPQVQFVYLSDPLGDETAEEVVLFWNKNQSMLPDADPTRTETLQLRQSLEIDKNPITLLLDENRIVRQAFVGELGARPIGRSIERLLQSAEPAFGIAKPTKRAARQSTTPPRH